MTQDYCIDSSPVLVMDSGVGGLSIAQEMRCLLPELPLLYLADNAALPYGNKSEAWLKARVLNLVKSVLQEDNIRMLVIACNTASTVVLDHLRAELKIPVVGVVPAIKPASECSGSGHIGLLATPGTVSRHYTDDLVKHFAEGCRVSRLGSTELVRLAEEKLAGKRICLSRLEQAMAPLFNQTDLDTIVLGCTHFPLLKPELEQIAPRRIRWVDSGKAVAERVQSLLQDMPQTSIVGQSRAKRNRALLTGSLCSGLKQSFDNMGYSSVQPLSGFSAGSL